VRTKLFNSDFHVARPFTVFGRTFAALALLFCIATPFMNDLPNRWTFLLGGFGYSAFLTVFVTGLMLLPLHARTRAFTALFIGFAFSTLVPVVILAILHFRLPFSIIHHSLPPLLWVSGGFIAVMFAFACYGWYYRLTHDATNVA
jgi:hypothetical protein